MIVTVLDIESWLWTEPVSVGPISYSRVPSVTLPERALAAQSPRSRTEARRAAAASELLVMATEGLAEAGSTPDIQARFVSSHLAALRAAAAVVAMRAPSASHHRISSVWELLTRVAPELSEWADFFAIEAQRRAEVVAGSSVATAREADDLLRDSVSFVQLVAETFGLSVGELSRLAERLAVR
jgi:hypothetical protein